MATETIELINGVMSGDKDSFDKMYDKYYLLVKKAALKWSGFLNQCTKNLYDLEDVENEMWEAVISKLYYYKEDKAKLSTFIYNMADQQGSRIRDHYSRNKRGGKEGTHAYLDQAVGENEGATMLDLLTDDSFTAEELFVDMDSFIDAIYRLKCMCEELKPRQRKYFFHRVIGLTLQESADIYGVSRQAIQPAVRLALDRATKVMSSNHPVNKENSYRFYSSLFLDEEDMDFTEISFETYKICKKLVERIGIREDSLLEVS